MRRRPAISLPRKKADEPAASAPARPWTRALRASLAARAPALFLFVFEPTTAELGRIGETLAARHMAAHGYRVIARRLGTPCGELDLVLRRGDLLLGLEVKTARARASIRPAGSSTRELADLRWRPGQRWSRRQARRAGRALRWLCTRTAWAREARLALVEVYVGPPHRFHLEPADDGARTGRRVRADRGPIN